MFGFGWVDCTSQACYEAGVRVQRKGRYYRWQYFGEVQSQWFDGKPPCMNQ